MARGRMLNWAVTESMKFHKLPDDTCRLMATWTISLLDAYGVFHADPVLVKSRVFPMRADLSIEQVQKYLDAMEQAGLIRRFVHDGRVYQYWPGFKENQPHLHQGREAASGFPKPPTYNPPQPPESGNTESSPEVVRSESGSSPEQSNIREVNLKESNSREDKEISAKAHPSSKPQKKSKAKNKPEPDPRSQHPAIQAVREVTERYPAKELYDEIIAVCGESPNLQRMRLCWIDWLKVSTNRANTTWLLEWYAQGASGNPNQHRQQQSPNRQPPAQQNDAERARLKAEAQARIQARVAAQAAGAMPI